MSREDHHPDVTPDEAAEVVRLRDAHGLEFKTIAERFGWKRMQRAHTIYHRAKAGTLKCRSAQVEARDAAIIEAAYAGAVMPAEIAEKTGLTGEYVRRRLWKMGLDRQEREELAVLALDRRLASGPKIGSPPRPSPSAAKFDR